ncbi:hypothetical protein [Deinococcus maricopensis]|uniref:Uncharacterized protein n=1 Tax=Deinococcus maricopensis (strain DSM 21211 / LMG 22137 / NRRL B-23946 / LB-34) TaxID=709986 RepID=E8UAB8_DEIML|nr:hypothetical protein [Deinococcus maricopensis]ADV68007.1 hypothetical protein Deima_2369 [Deinococcus maricopensis DSM 21211]
MTFEECSAEVRAEIEQHLPEFRERLLEQAAPVGMEAFDVTVRSKGSGALTVAVRPRVGEGGHLPLPATAEFELLPVQEAGRVVYRSTELEFATSAL